MELISKSGYFYANKFTRITLEAYEEVMGKNGLNAILNLAGLSRLIDNYPPDNLDRQFDFADFTALHIAWRRCMDPAAGVGWRCVRVVLLSMMHSRTSVRLLV